MSAPELARLHRAQCRLAATALEQILPGERAADAVLHSLLRGDRRLGARDRRWVTSLVYGVLRDVHALREWLGGDASPERLIAGWLAWRADADASRLEDLALDATVGPAPGPESLSRAARRNWPLVLDERLQAELGGDMADALAEALRQPAGVDLRVNVLHATRPAVRAALAVVDIEATPTPLAPHGLRLAARQPLATTVAWREGWIEPQDEGSQLVAALVAARPGERIADWCAGAGGKALAMAADMQDEDRIDAFDIDAARLARIGPRAQRLGVHCIRPAAYDDLDGTAAYDAVLVDAPCSGTGTLRRQPELALRDPDPARWAALQRSILDQAAEHVAVGGRLVYATCSLLRAENEDLTAAFLAAHPQFEIEPASEVLAAQGIAWQGEALRLWPHLHGSDGFYALRMRRRS